MIDTDKMLSSTDAADLFSAFFKTVDHIRAKDDPTEIQLFGATFMNALASKCGPEVAGLVFDTLMLRDKVEDPQYKAMKHTHEVMDQRTKPWRTFFEKRLPAEDSHIVAQVILRGPVDLGAGPVRRDKDTGLLVMTVAAFTNDRKPTAANRYFDVADVATVGVEVQVPETSKLFT